VIATGRSISTTLRPQAPVKDKILVRGSRNIFQQNHKIQDESKGQGDLVPTIDNCVGRTFLKCSWVCLSVLWAIALLFVYKVISYQMHRQIISPIGYL
jgi:hypothetical protein